MKTYFEFIRPNFRNLIILDVVFLLLVTIKLFFIQDFPWIFVFLGYITFWVVASIGYLWGKYKGYIN
jgi:hypothetical protein